MTNRSKIWVVVDGKEKEFNTAIDAAWELWRQRQLPEPAVCSVMPPEVEAEVMGELSMIEIVEGSS
jgi:hypothetical protein